MITGASRGIGRAIGLKLAKEGANIVVAAKTDRPHPTLPGTVHSAAAEMKQAGGEGLGLVVDVRDQEQVEQAVATTINHFGGIDILINNASAIALTNTKDTTMKRFDLMHQVNARGTYMMTAACRDALSKSANPHVLTISPPLNLDPRWFKNHLAYTMAKYGMSLCVLGHSEEFRGEKIAVNALWPRTAIATAAIDRIGGPAMRARCRSTAIMADAAQAIVSRPSAECTGNFFLDDEVMRAEGVQDLDVYAIDPSQTLLEDFFLPEASEQIGAL